MATEIVNPWGAFVYFGRSARGGMGDLVGRASTKCAAITLAARTATDWLDTNPGLDDKVCWHVANFETGEVPEDGYGIRGS